MSQNWQVDWGKLSLLALIIICVTIGASLHVGAAEDSAGYVYVAVIAYITGNGVRAVKGDPHTPLLDVTKGEGGPQ